MLLRLAYAGVGVFVYWMEAIAGKKKRITDAASIAFIRISLAQTVNHLIGADGEDETKKEHSR